MHALRSFNLTYSSDWATCKLTKLALTLAFTLITKPSGCGSRPSACTTLQSALICLPCITPFSRYQKIYVDRTAIQCDFLARQRRVANSSCSSVNRWDCWRSCGSGTRSGMPWTRNMHDLFDNVPGLLWLVLGLVNWLGHARHLGAFSDSYQISMLTGLLGLSDVLSHVKSTLR